MMVKILHLMILPQKSEGLRAYEVTDLALCSPRPLHYTIFCVYVFGVWRVVQVAVFMS